MSTALLQRRHRLEIAAVNGAARVADFAFARRARLTSRHAPVVLIAIPIAIVIAMGFVAAWFMYCRSLDKYPAFDMPSWQRGGTWRMYCL